MTVQPVRVPDSFTPELWSPRLIGQGILSFFGLGIVWLKIIVPVINNSTGNLWIVTFLLLIFYGAIFGLGWWFGPRAVGLNLDSLGFLWIRWKRLTRYGGGALILSLVFSGSYVLVCEYFDAKWLLPAENLPLPYSSIMGLLVLMTVVPLAEETFFRGFLYGGLTRRWGNFVGIMISSGMFAMIHIEIGHLIPAFVSGLIFSWAYRYSGSLWPAIFAHGGHNAVAWLIIV